MAERAASPVSSPIINHHHDTAIQSARPPLPPPPGAEIYVVQIPKDQIYRVPPPENALIIQRHHLNLSPKKRSSCTSCLFCFLLPLLLILGLAAASYIFIIRSREPTFHLELFFAKNNTKSHKTTFPEYNLKIISQNPNDHTNLIFQSGGDAYLSYKHEKIAYGTTPDLHIDHHQSKRFSFSLDGAKYKLPKEARERIGDTGHQGKLSLTLTINVPMRVESGWIRSSGSTLSVACGFTVDSLSKVSRILSQECRAHG